MPRKLRSGAMTGFPKSRPEMDAALKLFQSRGAHPSKGEMARAIQEQASRYVEQGLPDRKTEGWRHFPLQKIDRAGFGFSPVSGQEPDKAPRPPAFLKDSLVISVEGGRPRALFDQREEGIRLVPWRDILQNGGGLDTEAKKRVMRAFRRRRNSLCSLNSALSADGWTVLIGPRQKSRKPLEIQYLPRAESEKKQALNLRNFLFLQKGAEARVLETFYGGGLSRPGRPFFLSLQTDCFLDEESRLSFFRIDKAEETDFQLNQLFGEVEKGAEARFLTLSLGSGISRHLTDLSQAAGSSAEARGLALLGGRRHAEHKTSVIHKGAGGFSRQSAAAVLFDSARSVFNSAVRIEKQAQKTSASQLIRSLIFGEKAVSVSCPELDVGADDVKASHGASVSPLKENREAICYLRSRGLEDFQALSLILSGLIREIFSFADEGARQALESLAWRRLEALRDSIGRISP